MKYTSFSPCLRHLVLFILLVGLCRCAHSDNIVYRNGSCLLGTRDSAHKIYKVDIVKLSMSPVYSDIPYIYTLYVNKQATHIAFSMDDGDNEYVDHLKLLDLRHASARVISDLLSSQAQPIQWSPDGSRIAFITMPSDSHGQTLPDGVWLYDVRSDTREKIRDMALRLGWNSRDGQLYIMPTDDGPALRYVPRSKTFEKTAFHDIYFSGDGEYYYTFPSEPETTDVFSMKTNERLWAERLRPWTYVDPHGWRGTHFLLLQWDVDSPKRNKDIAPLLDCATGTVWQVPTPVVAVSDDGKNVIYSDWKAGALRRQPLASMEVVSKPGKTSKREDNRMNPFFAFKNSMESGGPASVEEQVQILTEIGFDGFDNRDLNDLEAALTALDRHKLKLYTIYFSVRIDPDETPFNEKLNEMLPLLKGRGTVLWCNTQSKRFKPSDPAGDEFAVSIFRKIADMAAPFGVRVAPYPHIGMWVESPEDTARLADKVDRPNFGTSFNLFHWNALGDRKPPIEEVVRRIAPRMLVMSINGDNGPHNIGPLESKDFNTYFDMLKAFRDAGYRGPVGLQCYLIPGDPRAHLGQSFGVWRYLKLRFEKE